MVYAQAPTTFTIGPPNGSTTNGTLGAVDINEFWYVDSDVQVGTGQITDGLFQQLAFEGPFSVPAIGAGVAYDPIEYRSFRDDPFGVGYARETYFRPDQGTQTWANGTTTGSAPITGANIVLPQFWRPGQINRPVLFT
jgi:hypothetical protein